MPTEPAEAILYKDACKCRMPLELDVHLATRASKFGVNLDSLTKLLARGHGDPAASAILLTVINGRRSAVLHRIFEIGSGQWRSDLIAYFKQTGPPALDDLFLLGGEVPDDIWGELMPAAMFPQLLKSKCKPEQEDTQENREQPENQEKLTKGEEV